MKVFLLLQRLSLTLAIGAIVVYVALCLFFFLKQSRLIFFPSPVVEVTPAACGFRYEEVWLPAVGGDRIHGWWIPAQGEETGALLYLHGNAINIGANVNRACLFSRLGQSVLIIDYRGYGLSTGDFPSEASVYQDARTAWNYLTQARKISPQQILVYGHSLGGAIAIELATQVPQMGGLIVEGSFTSIRDMAIRVRGLGMFPVDWFLTQRFDSISKVPSLRVPTLFIHGTDDRQTPADMTEALYQAAPNPKQLWLVPGAGHNDVAEVAGSEYLRVIQAFIQAQEQSQVEVRDSRWGG